MKQKINMSSLRYLLLIVTAIPSLSAKKDKDSVLDSINQRTAYIAKIVTELSEENPCTNIITAADIGTTGYVIDSPGQYCLSGDVSFDPAALATTVPVTFTGDGSGATGFAAVTQGVVIGVVMTNGGIGYTTATPVFGGSGTGATGNSIISGGAVTGVIITSGGSGYQDTVVSAIRISSANVTMNLQGAVLAQANKNNLFVNGIVVDPGLDNVTIANGTIRDFSQAAIQAGQTPSVPNPALLTNVKLLNLQTLNNGVQNGPAAPLFVGMGGILLYNMENVILDQVNANDNFLFGIFTVNVVSSLIINECLANNTTWGNYQLFGPTNTPYTGAFFSLADGNITDEATFAMTNSSFNNSVGKGQVTGLSFSFVPNLTVYIDSCIINGTTGSLSDATLAAQYPELFSTGIFTFFTSADFFMSNSEVAGTSYTYSAPFDIQVDSLGIHFEGDTIDVVKNCKVFDTTLTINSSLTNLVDAFGIIAGLGNRVIIENSEVNNVSVTDASGAALGFHDCGAVSAFQTNIFEMRQCTMSNVSININSAVQPTFQQCKGLDINTSVNQAIVEDSFVSYVSQSAPNPMGINGHVYNQAAGFKTSFDSNSSASAVFRRCVANYVTDMGGQGGLAFGFTTKDPKGSAVTPSFNVVFDSCVAENNTVLTGTGGSFGAGFNLWNASNSKIINCESISNTTGILVDQAAPYNSANNIVASNIILNNAQYGIYDTTSTSTTNAYYLNQAKANGATPAVAQPNDTNYQGGILNTHGAPMRLWQLPSGPSATDNNGHLDPIDNISINY